MTPEDRAAAVCATLIRDGLIREDGPTHYRLHDELAKAFREAAEPPPTPDHRGSP